MKIFVTLSVFILEKSYLYQNGVEFHQESNGIGGATVAPRGATWRHRWSHVEPRWLHFFTWPADHTTEFGQGGATRY